jgi:hypothetical protein
MKSIPLHHALRSQKNSKNCSPLALGIFLARGSILPLVETSLLTDGCTLLSDHNPKELYFSSGLFINEETRKRKHVFAFCINWELMQTQNIIVSCTLR